ncbi:unnamed protein product [Lactuca virosa]|uniref:Uncharacterized protein n=1 Tax=Lactuca virosa TaxID=75947 RepID=A0AAU9MU58_9ASTR|nr:unnamed protein product [Lactuca virosa]
MYPSSQFWGYDSKEGLRGEYVKEDEGDSCVKRFLPDIECSARVAVAWKAANVKTGTTAVSSIFVIEIGELQDVHKQIEMEKEPIHPIAWCAVSTKTPSSSITHLSGLLKSCSTWK